jgi:hypothetical protein
MSLVIANLILIALFAPVAPISASTNYTWTKLDFTCNCDAIATSNDGSKVVTADDFGSTGGHIYTSTNYGASWTSRASAQLWSALASSSDGTKLVATIKEGPIYTSNDSGLTWTMRASLRRWDSVASSSDGSKLVAGVEGGTLYTSSDSGVTWVSKESERNWTSVASSSDGNKLVAVTRADRIFTSVDSGATWIPRESARLWRSVASSSDGTKLAAAIYSSSADSFIYTSTDSGVTWAPRANDVSRYWQAIAMSSDGSKLVAASYMGTVYTSEDYGATWASGNSIQNGNAVASSSDGNTFFVSGTLGAYLYTTATIAKPKVTLTATPKASKGSVTTKKVNTKLYILTVRSNAPFARYTITATRKNKATYEYSGTTDSKGGAVINVSVALVGYSIVLKLGS